MLNRKGFSLIEVIICIAMMAILSVSVFSLSNHIKYADEKKCVKQLNQEIETARMTSMSKSGKWILYIYKMSDGCYYNLTNASLDKSKGVKFGNSKMKIAYIKKGGASEIEMTTSDTTMMKIQFSKNMGSFIGESLVSELYDKIHVSTSDSDGDVIRMVEKTGKHYVE